MGVSLREKNLDWEYLRTKAEGNIWIRGRGSNTTSEKAAQGGYSKAAPFTESYEGDKIEGGEMGGKWSTIAEMIRAHGILVGNPEA